jgi:hypothetical protein
MVESQSTRGLIVISKLFQEGRIDEDQRNQLKGKEPWRVLHQAEIYNDDP